MSDVIARRTMLLVVAGILFPLAGCVKNLHQAAEYGQTLDVDRMIDEDPSQINVRDKHGWTPFMYAVKGEHHEIAEKLLAAGADPTISANGWDAMHEAERLGNQKMMKIVSEAVKKWNAKGSG